MSRHSCLFRTRNSAWTFLISLGVVSSHVSGNKTYVQTKPISVMDAAPNSSFNFSASDLDPSEDLTGAEAAVARAVTGGPPVSASTIKKAAKEMGGTGLTNRSVNPGTKTGKCGASQPLSITDEISGNLSAEYAMSWNNILGVPASVKTAKVQSTFTLNNKLGVTASAGVSCSASFSLLPAPIPFQPITIPVGPIVVVLVPELDLKMTLSGKVTGNLNYSVTSQMSLTSGLNYSNGQTTPIHSLSKSASVNRGTITKSATASKAISAAAPATRTLLNPLSTRRINLKLKPERRRSHVVSSKVHWAKS